MYLLICDCCNYNHGGFKLFFEIWKFTITCRRLGKYIRAPKSAMENRSEKWYPWGKEKYFWGDIFGFDIKLRSDNYIEP